MVSVSASSHAFFCPASMSHATDDRSLPLDKVRMWITSHKAIAFNYIKWWFLVDVMTTCPFDLLDLLFVDEDDTGSRIPAHFNSD